MSLNNPPGPYTPPAVTPPPPPPHPAGYASGYPQQAGPGYAPQSDAARMMQYDAAKKSAGVAYVLWFFVGGFGAHRFYLGQTGTAVAQLVICLVSIILLFFVIGAFGLIALYIWLFVDLFLIPGLVRQYNQQLAAQYSLT